MTETVKSRRMRILPAVIIFAAIGFLFKTGNVFNDINSLVQSAAAQETTTPDPEATTTTTPETTPAADPEAIAETQPKPNIDPALMSRSELELLQDLARRRQELDARDTQIDLRERLLATTERRIDSKIATLQKLENDIKNLVQTQEERENAQMDSIVRVYERMKPKDAARIFERLDMKIQLDVATRMKETKMAPILAAMAPEAATKLTSQLATKVVMPKIEG